MSLLHRYKSMWVQVLFDLPVVRKDDRKAATEFRNGLLDLGFQMSQYSVYMKFCATRELVDTLVRKIELIMPNKGRVHILVFTDKQYENIRTFRGKTKEKKPKNPDQYTLF